VCEIRRGRRAGLIAIKIVHDCLTERWLHGLARKDAARVLTEHRFDALEEQLTTGDADRGCGGVAQKSRWRAGHHTRSAGASKGCRIGWALIPSGRRRGWRRRRLTRWCHGLRRTPRRPGGRDSAAREDTAQEASGRLRRLCARRCLRLSELMLELGDAV